MKFANLFFYFFVCWLSKSTFAAIVSDLKPDVNCDAVLASGTADRAKDPSIVSGSNRINLIPFVVVHVLFGVSKVQRFANITADSFKICDEWF